MNISRAEPEWDKSYRPDLKFESGLVKGFVSIVGPVPPYGRAAGQKMGSWGFYTVRTGTLGFFSQNVEGKLRQNEIFSNRSKGQRERFLRIWHFFLPYPN